MSGWRLGIRSVAVIVLLSIILNAGIAGDAPVPALAQTGDACEHLTAQALAAAARLCPSGTVGEVCAGYAALTVEEADGTARSLDAGERVPLTGVTALVADPADTTAGTWGLAVVTLPGGSDPAQAVYAVLAGPARLARPAQQEDDRSTLTITNAGGAAINYRNGAGITYDVIGQLAPGTTALADGRNAQSDWVRIRVNDTIGWVFAPLISWEGDLATLAVLLPNDVTPPVPAGEVFQSFTVVNGPAGCPAAPSGLLLQHSGPEIARLSINQIALELETATLLISAEASGRTTIAVLEGNAQVTARGVPESLQAGDVVDVALGGVDGLTPQAAPVQRSTPVAFASLAYAPLDLLPVPISCRIGLPAAVQRVALRVGPGPQRGEIGTMNATTSYSAIGWAPDPDGQPWWQLATGTQPSWVAQADVRAVGDCQAVPQVEAPPIVLAPPAPAGVPAGGAATGPDLAPTANSVWQMKPGTDNLVGECSGAPAINFCDHLAAISPIPGGLQWKGMEPLPYLLTQVQPNVYVYSGPNVLGTGMVTMTLSFTSPTTLAMTMSLILASEPNCQHVYYYSGTRNW